MREHARAFAVASGLMLRCVHATTPLAAATAALERLLAEHAQGLPAGCLSPMIAVVDSRGGDRDVQHIHLNKCMDTSLDLRENWRAVYTAAGIPHSHY